MGYEIVSIPGDDASTRPAATPTGEFTIVSVPGAARSTGESLAHGGGLGARAVVKGALSVPTAMLDAGITLGNLVNRGTNALGLTDAAPFPSASELTDRALDAIGLTRPETSEERIASDVLGAASGAGAGARFLADQATKATAPVARTVLDKLGAAPGAQAVAGGTGALAAGATREAGGDEWTQLAAGLAGAAAPSVVPAAAQATVRAAVRGGEQGRPRYELRRQQFEEAGVDPTVGQAAGTRRAQALEATLAKVPGGAGPMSAHAEVEARQMQAHVNRIADDYLPAANSTKAGLTIEKGLERFVDRFRSEQRFLYDKLDRFIPRDARVPVSNVVHMLDELSTPIQGAEHVSVGMMNPTIVKMRDLLAADAADGALPYDALKRLRTTVGEKIANPRLTDDVGTAQWKRIYGALSEDMATAARSAGPEAEQAFNRANWYTRAGHDRIEAVLDRVSGKATAEKVFQAAVNPSEVREGATTINAVMRSLSPDERRVVSAAVVRRLGQAAASAQDAAGEMFSSETFLSNWNKISPQAKSTLFADPDARRGLDALALAAQRMREGSQVLRNPSGTAPTAATIGAYGGLGASIMTGNLGAASTILAGIAGANGAARLMTNPKFVRWVGKTTEMPAELLPAQIQFLANQAAKWPKDERQAVEEFVAQMPRR